MPPLVDVTLFPSSEEEPPITALPLIKTVPPELKIPPPLPLLLAVTVLQLIVPPVSVTLPPFT